MKKLIILCIIIFTAGITFSQSVIENPIAKFSPNAQLDGYNFKFDPASSSYCYVQYDSTDNQFSIIGNRGNSARYGYIVANNTLFDKMGNYYHIANNNITDTTYTYFLMKNGKETATFDVMNENWRMSGDKIYFVCTDKNGTYLAVYNTLDGSITKGKRYDNITLVYYEQNISDGEPEGELGFTKSGKAYYMASLNGEKFLVIDNIEQKHYSDIDSYYLNEDSEGNMTYFAKAQGKFFENAGGAFVVQGTKEYGRKCDYLYGPILFDKQNNPIYVCADSAGNTSPQRMVTGETAAKTYNGGLYNLIYTPSGKTIYIATDITGKKYDVYKSFVVVDGKEGKRYNSITYFKVLPNDDLLYAASREDEQAVIVKGGKELETDYPNIYDVGIMPDGSLAYVGVIYGDNKKIKDRYYLVIRDDEMGPYDGMVSLDNVYSSYIFTDAKGNYAYIILNMKNVSDYITTQQLVTPKYESKEFDGIQDVAFYNGKVLWTGSRITNTENYTYSYRIYYNNKPIGREYDYIGDYKFDDKTGIITFTGMAGNEFFTVKIQL